MSCASEAGAECWNSEEIEEEQTRFVMADLKRAAKYSDLLGEEYVQSCELALAWENDIRNYHMSETCSVGEYLLASDKRDKCMEKAGKILEKR